MDDTPVLGIVVEVQLRRDDRKTFTWPVYLSTLRARLECPTCLLVVTPTPIVAEWCARPIDIGPGMQLRPIVLGPSAVPVVVDPVRARQDPELAVLSARAHGREAPDTAVRCRALRPRALTAASPRAARPSSATPPRAMPRPLPDAIAAAARPYLRQVVDLCSTSGLSPSHYVLLLGKYSSEETFLFPRSSVIEILERASAARRRKCERLIAAPCTPHDLLVMVCAGDHVEGHFTRVPTVVPHEAPPLTEIPPCSCTCGQLAEIEFQGLYYTRACLKRTVDELRAMGIPIEESDKGLRLAPSARVSFLLDDPDAKR